MARSRASDTRERIQAVALELFLAQGVQRTSLRQIADRLGVTKPALYYHFASRDDLVRSLFQPLLDDIEAVMRSHEDADTISPREVLGAYFDVAFRHRGVSLLLIRDLSALAFLDLERVVQWRRRVIDLLVGSDARTEDRVRAMVAVGGLSDCTVMFPDVPPDELRTAAIDAACAALGV